MDTYTPTYLYIKRHRVTGLLYFGKTINSDPVNAYDGSGTRWQNHCNKHGWDVETVWYCLFTDLETLMEFAIGFSEQEDIVKSKLWANLRPENGIEGWPPGHPFTDDHKANMRKPKSEETKAKMRASAAKRAPMTDEIKKKIALSVASKITDETRAQMSASRKGRKLPPRTEEHKARISAAKTGKKRHTVS